MYEQKLIKGTASEKSAALQRIVENDSHGDKRRLAKEGVDYYNYEHDILNNRIFYLDNEGNLKEDKTVSNIKIPHPFFTEQVDQKVNFLLANPVEFTTEQDGLEDELKDYYDAEFQNIIRDALEGASTKGYEFVFERTTSDDRLAFQISDSMQTIEIHDENGNRAAVIRWYNREGRVDGKDTTITVAELWDDQQVTFYKTRKGGQFEFDTDREENPRQHIVGITEEGQRIGRSYDEIPFYRLSNNKAETTDLQPIKALIDDYDLMAAFLSNNLQDFSEAIYVVKNYPGQDMTELRQNIKSRKMVGVGENGGLEVKTVNIPTDGRKLKLDVDKEAIYKFGMAFDSTSGLGSNIANVVIRSRYTLLEMKANKAENKLRGLLEWINQRVVNDINRRNNTSYDHQEVTITLNRDMMINKDEEANVAYKEAQTQQIQIQNVLATAARLDNETVLRAICDLLELDYEEVVKRIDDEDYTPLTTINTDPPATDEQGEGEVNDEATA